MSFFHQYYDEMTSKCICGGYHEPLTAERIEIGRGAISQLGSFLHDQSFYRPLLVYDSNTKAASEDFLKHIFGAGTISYNESVIPENEQGDVLVDEQSIVHLLAEASSETDVMIAAGAGSIHDIVRFASYKMKIPFISVPTAPSVDGFTSQGAPIIRRKVKETYPTQPPIALFADLDILRRAPTRMVYAGFGDMLGKYTSLADWKFSAYSADEPYCDAAAAMTASALERCVYNRHQIAQQTEYGIDILMRGLIESVMAMAMFGSSHPASGAEHHLSHYWEMAFLQNNQKQLLHGEKVGMACAIIADYYHDNRERILSAMPLYQEKKIREIFADIPAGRTIRSYLYDVGNHNDFTSLGISEELIYSSLNEAHRLRNRNTMLKKLNEI
ncbi:sn-glycerol-1-phosphate dehydrogenase [Salisediminibacterium halotolerans]|uniref:Glycerol-1-phosphate dehydrogenase [NAD(P)+] n=1 Tax=Salisediminibacterium halotolerans TaxID=517425 RepID=A0A1H9WJW6_9BACI|nr:sn-glycerol-1-phosphate dehydrogenase [Salisediminibacterium haloalkalitolerans]SES34226.1 glycerol-1-phosphate dehydrogenase [NAD(P)+] [Salisediminibacterium haloalkalitolerans]